MLGAAERKMGHNYLSQVGTEGSPHKAYSGGLVFGGPRICCFTFQASSYMKSSEV